MNRNSLKRKDVDLVHVIWESDQGVVSLNQGKTLFYVWGRISGHHSTIPTVDITDDDFRIIMKPVEDDPGCFEATWDDVPNLLNHRRFPLMRRLVP